MTAEVGGTAPTDPADHELLDIALDPPGLAASGVTIRGLRKRYGDTVALAGLDLDARPGEILGVAGPNGAGKSTMVKNLAGELAADEGENAVDGAPWSSSVGWQRVAVVHQEPQLFPNLTVAENIVVGRERSRWLRHGVSASEQRLLADLAIDGLADRPLETVSLAVQQRTEIARALAQDARVFLFDEPNSALTDEESDDLFRRMHALAAAGRVVILVSHRLAELVTRPSRDRPRRPNDTRLRRRGLDPGGERPGAGGRPVRSRGATRGPADRRRSTAPARGLATQRR